MNPLIPVLILTGIVVAVILIVLYTRRSTYVAARPDESQELVVALCKEKDVAWIDKKAGEFQKVTVYDKCKVPPDFAAPNLEVVRLPNIGSCDYAYLTYIIDRYDTLPDFVEFTKASLPATKRRRVCKPPETSNWLMSFSLKDPYRFTHNKGMDDDDEWHITPFRNLGEWLDSLDLRDVVFRGGNNNYNGGHFAATREQILQTPKSKYEEIRSGQTHRREKIDHFIERLWGPLMCKDERVR
jgi:hypothetical protein